MQDRGAPAYFVAVRKSGEKAEPVDLTHKVLSLQFEDNESKADVLTLTVDNFDLANFDDPVWAHGNILQFAFGYESGTSPVREAVIRSVKGGTTLSIEAHAKSVTMDRIKRRESFENMTRSEVVEKIAARNGYQTDTLILGKTEERFEIITQNNLTDAQMLRKLAHLEGKEFFVDFDGLHWHERDLEQAPIREFVYYTDPNQGDIVSFSVENDITRKPGRVRVRSRNPETKETITGTADNETDADRAILQGTRALEEFLDVDEETGDVETGLQPVAYEEDVISNAQTEAEANTEAKRRFRKATQQAVLMDMVIVGDPNVIAKSVVKISGLGSRLSGKYYIKVVTSTLSGGEIFGQQLKLITDGYQRKHGAGSGKTDAGSLALAAALQELSAASLALKTSAPAADRTGQVFAAAQTVFNNGVKLVESGSPPKDALAKLAKQAVRLGGLAKTSAKAVPNTDALALQSVALAAEKVAAIARRMANTEDVEAKGKLNEKDVGDARALVARQEIDVETGETTSGYVEVRSRGQK